MFKRSQGRFMKKFLIAGGMVFCLWVLIPGFSFSEEIRYQSGDRRDPFVPINRTTVASPTASGIQVEGIIYDAKGRSMVVIGGETYKVGDSIGNQKIVEIYPSRIVVSMKGAESEYWISSAEQELAKTKKK